MAASSVRDWMSKHRQNNPAQAQLAGSIVLRVFRLLGLTEKKGLLGRRRVPDGYY